MKRKENIINKEKLFKNVLINLNSISKEDFIGNFKSVFKGEGIEFFENREYNFGDSIKNINWSLTARYGKLYTKVFHEERNKVNIVLLDYSSSIFFSSTLKSKYEIMTEIALILLYSSMQIQDQFAFIVFSDKIIKFFPVNKGEKHFFTIFNYLKKMKFENSKFTDYKNSFQFVYKILKKHSNIFIISDFIDFDAEEELKILSSKHSIIGFSVNDPFEISSQNGLKNYYINIESQNICKIPESNFFIDQIKKIFLKSNCDFLNILTTDKYISVIKNYFKNKKK